MTNTWWNTRYIRTCTRDIKPAGLALAFQHEGVEVLAFWDGATHA